MTFYYRLRIDLKNRTDEPGTRMEENKDENMMRIKMKQLTSIFWSSKTALRASLVS